MPGKAKWFYPLLLVLPLLLTGCPHNEYVVELTPHGERIERKLVFYCADGTNSAGQPSLQSFPKDELAAIRRLYPQEGFKSQGDLLSVTGEFVDTLPSDVGGAGSYKWVKTDLGSAGFYMERFRGDDDQATQMTARFKAVDQLVDMVIGWSRMELGHERGYKNLRKFLDGDFRRDFKNLALYLWMQQVSSATKARAPEEFWVRFGQYLVEHGYLKPEELSGLVADAMNNKSDPPIALLQRLVADKLGLKNSGPFPKSLNFLSDSDLASKSWEKFLTSTETYRDLLRHWEVQKISIEAGNLGRQGMDALTIPNGTNGAWGKKALPGKPAPTEVTDQLFGKIFDFDPFSTDDVLTVKLSLPFAPVYYNGQWNVDTKQATWTADLENKPPTHRLPGFCYATWVVPDAAAQTNHFGKVLLDGNELLQYCVWHAGLDAAQTAQWDSFVAGLSHGPDLSNELSGFHFSGEPAQVKTTNQTSIPEVSDFAKDLIKSALDKNAATLGP